MRFHALLEEIAGSRAKARVLETLLAFPHKQWTGRELALHAGVSQPQAAIALEALRQNGLVERRQAGRARLWSLNREHLLAKWLEPFGKPSLRLGKLLVEGLGKKIGLSKIAKIVLFGSVARGSEKASSDIDLLVIVKKREFKQEARQKTLDLSAELLPVIGNPVIPIVYSEEEAKQKRGSPLFKQIGEQGIVVFDGDG